MSEPEPNQAVHITFVEGKPPIATQGNLRVEFSSATGTGLTVNGREYGLKDGVLVPANEVGAPAIMRHKLTSGRYGLRCGDIGQRVDTDNVYHGILLAPHFRHISRNGQLIGPRFDVFTTGQDTRHITRDRTGSLETYNQDIQRIANLYTYGHKGIPLHHDTEIYYAALHHPELLARWHMPVRALVDGADVGRHQKQHNPDNMYNHSETGLLAGSFTKVRGPDYPHWYQTASEYPRDPSRVYTVLLAGRDDAPVSKGESGLSSRPVRAELRPAG